MKKAFRLLLDNVNDTDPSDIAYTYAGYAPLSIRLVEHALRSGSGDAGSKEAGLEEALKTIPGPAFHVLQTLDEHGLPVEQPVGPGLTQGQCNAHAIHHVSYMPASIHLMVIGLLYRTNHY